MSIYQLYGTTATSTDSLASLDVQFDGELTAWSFECFAADVAVVGDQLRAEVSFLSSSCFSSNDCRGVICAVGGAMGALTSGGGLMDAGRTLSGLRIPVTAGERIHLHVLVSGVQIVTRAILYVLDSTDPRLRRRR